MGMVIPSQANFFDISDASGRVIYDDVNDKYWIWDMSMFTNLNYVEQIQSISELKYFGVSNWEIAKSNDMDDLFAHLSTENTNVFELFGKSDTSNSDGPIDYQSFFWLGRYDSFRCNRWYNDTERRCTGGGVNSWPSGITHDVEIGKIYNDVRSSATGAWVMATPPKYHAPAQLMLIYSEQSSYDSQSHIPAARKAIDGTKSGRVEDASITQTINEFQPWWEVNLIAQAKIDRVSIYNSDACCGARLKNFYLLISQEPYGERTLEELLNDSENITWKYFPGEAGDLKDVNFDNTIGQYVRIQLAETGVLSLAEVEVFGRSEGQLFGGVTTVADRFQNEDAAYFFDGFDDYIQINRKVENDFTITAWVKTTDQTDSCNAISDGKGIIDAQVDGSANDFAIVLCGSKVAFGVGSPDVMIKSTGSINTGNWTFVTVSRSSLTGEIKLYVDGLLQSSAIAGKQSLNASDKINIGALLTLTGTSYFKGSVSQAAFYHGTLTDIGVQTLYKESLISANGQQSVINTTHETVITNTSYLPYNSVSNNIDLKTWMSKVDDDTPLKQLFIPGTHDSGTFAGNFHLIQLVHTADITAIRYLIDKIPGITLYYGRTQNWNVSKQLENGIRFLDIRISDSNMFHSYKFQIRHGDDVGWGWVYHSYYGDFKKGIFDKVIEFLQINDQETVLMSIKKEGKNSTLDIKQFEKDFLEDSHFFTGSDANVTLKAVRGKIVLFSRSGFIPSEKRPGIKWGDTENFNIQDNYNDITVANKIEFVKEHFKASKDKNKYWVNFGSAYEVKVVFPILDHLAEGVNAAISTYLNDTSTDVCAMTGSIVPMDYPTRDAIHSIISANKSYRSQKITWPPTHSEVFNNLFLLI